MTPSPADGHRSSGGALGFAVLGPLTVRRDGAPLDIGPIRQQALLAVLLLCGGHAATPQFLLDSVWGEDVPTTGDRVIAPYIYRLRKNLDPVGTGSKESLIGTDSQGYLLRIAPDALDLTRFTALTAEAGEARAAGDTSRAAGLLRTALRLWEGEPLAGLPGPFVAAQRQRLTELRLTYLEQRIEIDLALGAHAEVVAELRDLLAGYPLRETIAAHLMLALHRCNRRAEALAVYTAMRATLVGELGIEPGQQLQRMQRLVLEPDEEPEPATEARETVRAGSWRVRCDLPAPAGNFVGRSAESDRLLAEPAGGSAALRADVVTGMAGVGKTALVLRVAHQLIDRYPDGQLFVDLHGHTPDRPPLEPGVVLDRLLRSVGVPAAGVPEDVEERAALWRASTAGRRILLVLDNARDAAQVRPLLPGNAASRVLVTTRERMGDLEAAPVAVDVLSECEAVSLFGKLSGYSGADGADGSARADGDADTLVRVVRWCGHLPLALRIAASRLKNRPGWTLEHLAARLAEGGRLLTELSGGDRGVEAAFAMSYESLGEVDRAVFRLLGVLPGGDFGVELVAAVAELSVADVGDALDRLVDANLLQENAPARFRLHDLLRSYARRLLAAADAGTARDARARALDYCLNRVLAANEATAMPPPRFTVPPSAVPGATEPFADEPTANAWLDTEYAGCTELGVHTADAELLPLAWRLLYSLTYYYEQTCRITEWQAAAQHVLDAGIALGERATRAFGFSTLGRLKNTRGMTAEGIECYQRSGQLFQEVGDAIGELRARANRATGLVILTKHQEAIAELERVLELAEAAGDELVLPSALGTIGVAYCRRRQFDQAIEYLTRARAAAVDQTAKATVLNNLGWALSEDGQLDRAEWTLRSSLRITAGRSPTDQLYALGYLMVVLARLGRFDEAFECRRQVESLFGEHAGALPGRLVTELDLAHGEMLLLAGRYADATSQYREALAKAFADSDRLDMVRAYEGLAHGTAGAGRPAEAREYAQKALDIAKEAELPDLAEIRGRLGADGSGICVG